MVGNSTILQHEVDRKGVNELPPCVLLHGGKYKIIKTLGKGGFGITYLAEQIAIRGMVCIKEFFPSTFYRRSGNSSLVEIKDEDNIELISRFKKKFLKEAQTISSMNHPNIVKVFDYFEENETAYYVMEYIEGESIQAKISNSPLDVATALNYINGVADALEYLHNRNTLHLDIKPHNIMVRSDGSVVVIDFGLAKHYDEESGSATTTTLGAHSDGYAPIEQYGGGSLSTFSPETDIYSLGATLYAMVVGSRPPRANELVRKGMLVIPDHIPHNVRNTIEQCMHYDMSNRPHNISEFRKLMYAHRSTLPKWLLWFIFVLLSISIVEIIILIGGSTSQDQPSGTHSTNVVEEGASGDDGNEGVVVGENSTGVTEEPKGDVFDIENYSYSVTTACGEVAEFSLDYPASGNPFLIRNVREWIVDELDSKYEGDINDPEALVDYFKQQDLKDDEGSYIRHVEFCYESDKVVSFGYFEALHWWGAANYFYRSYDGATFRKSDGKRFTWEQLQINEFNIKPLLEQKLMAYFNVTTEEELSECLMYDDTHTYGAIPLPQHTQPYINDGKIVVVYSEYEIARYGFEIEFTFEELKPYLSTSAIREYF